MARTGWDAHTAQLQLLQDYGTDTSITPNQSPPRERFLQADSDRTSHVARDGRTRSAELDGHRAPVRDESVCPTNTTTAPHLAVHGSEPLVEDLIAILKFATREQLDSLRDDCCDALVRSPALSRFPPFLSRAHSGAPFFLQVLSMDGDNCCDVLLAAQTFQCCELKAAVMNHIISNFDVRRLLPSVPLSIRVVTLHPSARRPRDAPWPSRSCRGTC